MTPEGLMLFEVEHNELRNHLVERRDHHAKRNADLIREIREVETKQEESLVDAESVTDLMETKVSSGYSNNQYRIQNLRDSARRHASRSVQFDFLARHLPDAKSFQLSLDELSRLELTRD